MEIFLIKTAQLILAFAILVIIHEFGHFLFARIFGVKVEKFYIFFNPWTSLFKWKPKKYVGSFSKNRYFSEEARKEDEERILLETTSEEVDRLTSKLKKLNDSRANQGEINKTEAELSKAEKDFQKALNTKTVSDKNEFDSEKKESRWKRFWGHTE
ncbi:MAG: site-2 protease family protein, partial [Muribaculaceae bacterium]|nr:site-2 protease family protein [Muribaculaceae bacterium]